MAGLVVELAAVAAAGEALSAEVGEEEVTEVIYVFFALTQAKHPSPHIVNVNLLI